MAGGAYADESGFYITGDGGVSLLPDLHIRLAGTKEKETFSTGEAFGGAVGYNFGNGFHTEVDGLHSKSDLDTVGGVHASGHLNTTSVMLNGIYDFTQDTMFIPFSGVGIGEVDIGASAGEAHDSDWAPGYQALAGLRHDFAPNISGFAEYRFQQIETARLTLAGTPARKSYANNGILIGFTFRGE